MNLNKLMIKNLLLWAFLVSIVQRVRGKEYVPEGDFFSLICCCVLEEKETAADTAPPAVLDLGERGCTNAAVLGVIQLQQQLL